MFKVLIALFAMLAVASAASSLDAGKNFNSDINNLDFGNIIGGPMSAVVKAQATAALTTINFVKQVGFTNNSQGQQEVLMMRFNYRQSVNNGTEFMRSMEMPFLYIVPIPYIVFTTLSVHFNMNLKAVADVKKLDTLDVAGSLDTEINAGIVNVALSGSVAYQQSTAKGTHVERDYSMKVEVEASQSEQPEGVQQLLRLFEQIVITDLPLRGA